MKFSKSTTPWFSVTPFMVVTCLILAGCGDQSHSSALRSAPDEIATGESEEQALEMTAAPSVEGMEGAGNFGGGGFGNGAETDDSVVADRDSSIINEALSSVSQAAAPADELRGVVVQEESKAAANTSSSERFTDDAPAMVKDNSIALGVKPSRQQPGLQDEAEARQKRGQRGRQQGDDRKMATAAEGQKTPHVAPAGKAPAAPAPEADPASKPDMPGPAHIAEKIVGHDSAAQEAKRQTKPIQFRRPEQESSGKDPAYHMGHRFMLMDSFNEVAKLSKANRKTVQLDLQPGEELWIIAKAGDSAAAPSDDTPGCGALMATLPNHSRQVPVPLKHTSVTGNIDGYIATVNVTQQFHNPYDSKIEAVYVFPLPQSAAVNEFVMTVGDRKIRGIIREREKAEQIYAAAKRQGHVASLMTQERANIFTQKVANIEPGKKIDIDIRYFNTLQYDDGAYEFVFPMVVGPRFNPAATSDGVGAVARGTNGTSGQKTEVSYLAPNERSGHDISLSLNISAGVDIEDVHCVNHAVDVKDVSETERTVQLSANDSIPNKDFVLRYKVAGDQIKTAMLTHEDKHGKYFTMMLYPPADLEQVNRSPMEMVFVLDCSGSMNGKPLAQAKAAISHALQSLTPRDTFQIIRFSNNASQLGAEPVLATEENIQRGLKYLTSLNSTGGTHMIEGIKAALDFPHDEGRFRLVSFMTDGYIGNEQQILSTMYDKLGASRVFSFGVGSSPNRMLMNRMAILGRGAVAYLSLNDNATEIMDGFNRRISHPAMTDLTIDWGDMRVADAYPQRVPDLIVGRPVVITGRFKGEAGTVSVNGRVEMEPKSFQVSLDEDGAKAEHKGIAAVWARLKIKDMMNVASHAPEAAGEIKDAVTQTALAYNLMSSFTAFVAVDSMTKTDGDYGTTVAVPVPVPEGVKYETTVGVK